MASAIELYKQAYDLDFRHGDLDYAEALYREIIQNYPQAEEKEYAELHLERIRRLRSDPQNPTLKSHQRSEGVNGLVIFNLMLSLLTIVALGFGVWFTNEKQREIKSLNLIIDGQLSEKERLYGTAVEKYFQASKLTPQRALPHRVLAELYLKQNEFKLANLEGKQWLLLSPNDKSAKRFSDKLAKRFSK